MIRRSTSWLFLLLAMGVACSGPEAPAPAAAPTAAAAAVVVATLEATPAVGEEVVPPTAAGVVVATLLPSPTPPADMPAPTAVPTEAPVEVVAFTPSQQEGPYYPVNKLDDRDSNLAEVAGADGRPQGELLAFGGRVYDAAGLPVEGAVVEIWQTDSQGIYLHPNDPGTANRDPNFQFYGESVTGPDGGYAFRTILPGRYEPRPRHIHVKVRLAGRELLTTQFYFADEVTAQGADALLVIDLQPAVDSSGQAVLLGERDIFLSVAAADR